MSRHDVHVHVISIVGSIFVTFDAAFPGAIKKTVWSVISLLMVLCLVGNLVLIVTNYLKFKVDIIIQMQHQRELVFPAISICNINPVRASMVPAVADIDDLVYGDLCTGQNHSIISVYYATVNKDFLSSFRHRRGRTGEWQCIQ